MAEIVKLRAKQTINNALYYYNRFNITLIYNPPLNFKVLVWRKSGNQTRPYHLLAVEDKTCRVQLPSGPISFRSISVKPYFQSKNTHNIELNKLKAPAKLDELKAPAKLNKLETLAELNKLEVLLPTLEVPQKPTKTTKPTVKCN